MKYGKLPHGMERKKFSVLGLETGGIGTTPVDEIETIIRNAIESGEYGWYRDFQTIKNIF